MGKWDDKLNLTCFEPLRHERSWTLEVYQRIGGYESWRNILANPEAPHVMVHDDRVTLYGDLAIVQCEEELDAGHLVATNMFIREAGAWKMIHHQASQIVMRGQDERRRRPSPTRH